MVLALAAVYAITIVSGDGQRKIFGDGGTGFAPLVVRVGDRAGRPVAGVPVRFDCVAPDEGCFLGSLRGGVAATVTTGRDGRATLGTNPYGVYVFWTRANGYTRKNPSPVEVIASLPSDAGSVRFHLTPITPYSLPSNPFYLP